MRKLGTFTIIEDAYPDGRMRYRVKCGRGWVRKEGGGLCDYGARHYISGPISPNEIAVFNTREQAEKMIRELWDQWISELPPLRRREYYFDPCEAQHDQR